MDVGDPSLSRVRVAQPVAGVTRIVLDTKRWIEFLRQHGVEPVSSGSRTARQREDIGGKQVCSEPTESEQGCSKPNGNHFGYVADPGEIVSCSGIGGEGAGPIFVGKGSTNQRFAG